MPRRAATARRRDAKKRALALDVNRESAGLAEQVRFRPPTDGP
ncbi:MAG: hypothetical protein ABIJ09_15330 [Pseudomonadota bacterium]